MVVASACAPGSPSAASSIQLCTDGGWEPVEDEVTIVHGDEAWGTYDVYLLTSYDTVEVWVSLGEEYMDFPLGDSPSTIPEEGGEPLDLEISYQQGIFLIGYGHVKIKQCNGRLYYKRIPIAVAPPEGSIKLEPAASP